MFLYSLEHPGSDVGCASGVVDASVAPASGAGVPAFSPSCHLQTDASGAYSIANLPCGKYVVVPHFKVCGMLCVSNQGLNSVETGDSAENFPPSPLLIIN